MIGLSSYSLYLTAILMSKLTVTANTLLLFDIIMSTTMGQGCEAILKYYLPGVFGGGIYDYVDFRAVLFLVFLLDVLCI